MVLEDKGVSPWEEQIIEHLGKTEDQDTERKGVCGPPAPPLSLICSVESPASACCPCSQHLLRTRRCHPRKPAFALPVYLCPFNSPSGLRLYFSEALSSGVIVTPRLVLIPAADLGFHVLMVYPGKCGHCFAPSCCPETCGFPCLVSHMFILRSSPSSYGLAMQTPGVCVTDRLGLMCELVTVIPGGQIVFICVYSVGK